MKTKILEIGNKVKFNNEICEITDMLGKGEILQLFNKNLYHLYIVYAQEVEKI